LLWQTKVLTSGDEGGVFMIRQVLKSIQRLTRWFFEAPFRQLPPEFGETVPPELLAFEAKAEESQHHSRERVQPSSPNGAKQAKSHH
jgi:hypothetical protein